MKNIKYLLGLLAVVLVMASCTSTRGAYGDDMEDARTRQVGNRVYMDDPYYGTIILERDPYTGRYYDVTPSTRYGNGYGYGYGYGSPYGNYYRGNGRYRSGTVNRNYEGNGNVVKPQAPSREEIRQDREATRRKVLGGN